MELIRFADGLLIRPSVSAFARLMELTLRKHDGKKGGQDNWRKSDPADLVDGVKKEFEELHDAWKHWSISGSGGKAERDASDRMAEEAVDVANMAMMVADNAIGSSADDPIAWPLAEPAEPALSVVGPGVSRTLEIKRGNPDDVRVVYVAGPYRSSSEWGVEGNIMNAQRLAAELWRRGYVVLCPHKNSAHFGGLIDDETFLLRDLELLERCDAIVLAPNWHESKGTMEEVRFAESRGILVFDGVMNLRGPSRPSYFVPPSKSDRERFGWDSTSPSAAPVVALSERIQNVKACDRCGGTQIVILTDGTIYCRSCHIARDLEGNVR